MRRFLIPTCLALLMVGIVSVTYGVARQKAPQRASDELAFPCGLHPQAPDTPQCGKRPPTLDELISQGNTQDIVAINQMFGAYIFYRDSGNTEAVATLFTPDGVDDHLWNKGDGTLVHTFGIDGKGCVSTGRAQIAKYVASGKPVAYPRYTRHTAGTTLVKVHGDEAIFLVDWFYLSIDPKTGVTSLPPNGGTYLGHLVRTPEGWLFKRLHVILNYPTATKGCDLDGPLPR